MTAALIRPTRRRPTSRGGAVAVLALLTGGGVATAQFDQIYPPTGSPIRGQITSITPTSVKISVSGSDRDVPVDQIRVITFASDPPELVRARELSADRRYEDALKELAAIAGGGGSKAADQDIAFYKAEAEAQMALAGRGDPVRAAAAVNAFLQTGSDSYHFFPAKELFADLAFASGKFGPAEEQYADLVSKAPGTETKFRAKLRQADAQRYGGKPADAIKNYDQLLGATGTGEALAQAKLMAGVGKAAAQAESGDPDAALAALKNLVKTGDTANQELFGRIYNALGDTYRAKKDNQQALLNYLKTHLLFFGTPTVHAESLYHLTGLWEGLGQTERANEARNLLKSKYGGTFWATRS